ncbi:hypothetical protein CH063_04783 [Colletotrichum higginsianum]|uniref:Uncharacterized protein n=1 Tax=Colletotrichum higginsianum (strain IMI 349063) TaxID=759273 RepID=H1UWN2_COLHI|nr:hypothetical protein CH063_04783 [Colletotrichum higginsianum]
MPEKATRKERGGGRWVSPTVFCDVKRKRDDGSSAVPVHVEELRHEPLSRSRHLRRFFRALHHELVRDVALGECGTSLRKRLRLQKVIEPIPLELAEDVRLLPMHPGAAHLQHLPLSAVGCPGSAANAVAGFDEKDGLPGQGEVACGCESGEASSNDDDVLM